MKKTIDSLDPSGRRILVRLDLNVPIDGNGRITDDRRIQAALPTVKKLLNGGGRLVLMSHFGRPEGDPDARTKYTLAPVAARLRDLLTRPVRLLPDCVGDEVSAAVAAMKDCDIVLLENLRFHAAEQIKDKEGLKDPAKKAEKERFAGAIAALGDAYVNDAFGTCHRDNASMLTVPQMMAGKPRVVGYLVQRELKFLGEAIADPQRPFVCVLGGAKVSDKLGVIQSLLGRCDTILVGGAMAYTFLKADGVSVGRSLVEEHLIETARKLRAEAGAKLRLPVDSVCATEIRPGVSTKACRLDIAPDLMGLDIGLETARAFAEVIRAARTIVWNGPMGVFETKPFDSGTFAIAKAVAEATDRGAVSIVGGGDSAAAVDAAGLATRITHVSTGGGASLEFLEGRKFAALEVLDDA